MADDNNAARYGVDAGLGVLGIVLGVATGDKELTRAGYKSTSDTTRTLTGTNQPQYEPPRNVPGKVETVAAAPAPATVSPQPQVTTPPRTSPPATPSGRFDPFTLEPR